MRRTLSSLGTMFICAGLSSLAPVSLSSDGPASQSLTRAKGQGAASLAGIVLSSDGARSPVRRAVVTLSGAGSNRVAITDETGRFRFDRLPTGRVTLTVTKPGYLSAAYGALQFGEPGTQIVIPADGTVRDLTIELSRGGVITGCILDPAGEPAVNVRVSAVPVAPRGSGQAVTDSRGIYRIFGLPPGAYLLYAQPAVTQHGDTAVLSVAEIDAILGELRDSSIRGEPARDRLDATPTHLPRSARYAPVFYPGTSDPAQAAEVRVEVGGERRGIDFSLQLVPTAKVSGVVIAHDGQSVSGVNVAVAPTLRLPPGLRLVVSADAPLESDGQFVVANITQGRYTIGALKYVPFAPPGGPPSVWTLQPGYWATTTLEVAGEDISGLSLLLRPTLRLSGRVVFEGGTLARPKSLSGMRIGLTMVGEMPGLPSASPRPVQVKTDGTFEISHILPGTYDLAVVPPPAPMPGWWLRAATSGGRDLLERPIEIGATGDLVGATLTLSDRHTKLLGTVHTPSGRSPLGYLVVVFPADPERWHPQSRRIVVTTVGTDGQYSVQNLPPGDYAVVATPRVDPAECRTIDYLSSVFDSADRVSVREGEEVNQDLWVASSGDVKAAQSGRSVPMGRSST